MLQPLVENALRHAVAPREEGGNVVIGARVARAPSGQGEVRVWVADDGPGLNGSGKGNGIGLANTRERLQQLYGSSHRFELRAERPDSPPTTLHPPPSGLRAEIALPLR
jgi:sensor histidine kinase YesM